MLSRVLGIVGHHRSMQPTDRWKTGRRFHRTTWEIRQGKLADTTATPTTLRGAWTISRRVLMPSFPGIPTSQMTGISSSRSTTKSLQVSSSADTGVSTTSKWHALLVGDGCFRMQGVTFGCASTMPRCRWLSGG